MLLAHKSLSGKQWPKALVEQTFPDHRGIVRHVFVEPEDGVYRIDVRNLFPLKEQLLGVQDGINPSLFEATTSKVRGIGTKKCLNCFVRLR